MENANYQNFIEQAVLDKLLSGAAKTGSEAEEQILDERLMDIVGLVSSSLTDQEFRNHPLVRILFAHGSRGW